MPLEITGAARVVLQPELAEPAVIVRVKPDRRKSPRRRTAEERLLAYPVLTAACADTDEVEPLGHA